MSSVLKKLKEKVREPRPNEAVIPPPLTFEEAELAWRMQLQSQFKKAGMDKYLVREKIEGGYVRPAVRDSGGLCDHPDCPNEYEYALELDKFKDVTVESKQPNGHGFIEADQIRGMKVPPIHEESVILKGDFTIFVCDDHKDWRPDIIRGHRFSKDYTPSLKLFEPGTSKVPNILKVEDG